MGNTFEEQKQQFVQNYNQARTIMEILGDEVRQEILLVLIETGGNGGIRVGDIQKRSHISRSAVSHTFDFKYTTDKEATVNFTHTFTNERVDATIKLVKKDEETGETPQGDATLEGAVYGLFAREDIQHPDGKTGVIYKAVI